MIKDRTIAITQEVKVLKYMRHQAGLSLRKAGKKFGISDGAISHIENGKMKLPPSRIEEMVCAYGFTMSDFFTLTRAKKLPNHYREECERLLATIPSSELLRILDFLRTIKREAST